VRYQHYAAKWMLPTRRLQMQLGQAALWSARAAGVSDVDLSDFLFDPVEDSEDEDAETFFEFNPINKRSE
jgi:hypothetical protein